MRRKINEDVAPERTKKKLVKNITLQSNARSSWWVWAGWGLIALCAVFMALPYVLRLFPVVLQCLVHSHAVTYFVDLSRPADIGLNHTMNIYLNSEEGVTLGIWHTVPEQKWKEAQRKGPEWYEKSLGDGSPIFIYLHGNMGNRAAPHRVGVANVLSSLGYHALVIDYRGFGDSIGEPTEDGLTNDALCLYQWVRARSKDSLVIIWGQSLGTGVGTNTAVKLQEQGNPVDGMILEGSFTRVTIPDIAFHPMIWHLKTTPHISVATRDLQYYWRFPYIQYFFQNRNKLKENKFTLPNDENLKKLRTPLLILHAKDDNVVSFQMAEELYSIAKSAQKSDDRVKLVLFDGSLGYLHNGLYMDPNMPSLLREFVQALKS